MPANPALLPFDVIDQPRPSRRRRARPWRGDLQLPLEQAAAPSIIGEHPPAHMRSRRRPRRSGGRSAVGSVLMQTYTGSARGLYRIFNAAEYRFWCDTSPPDPTDAHTHSNATLPYSPVDVFGTGTHYFAVAYFNGVLTSGFRAFAADYGARFKRIVISSGAQLQAAPKGPRFTLEVRSGGVVRINAYYLQAGALRATEWAIAYTTNGSTPAADSPSLTPAFTQSGLEVLRYDLPAQANGTTVKVRVQVRRDDDPPMRYSEGSEVKTATAVTTGPAAPSPEVQN